MDIAQEPLFSTAEFRVLSYSTEPTQLTGNSN